MSFRNWKASHTPVVIISGVPYILDASLKRLRAVHDPEDCIELEEASR